MKLHQRINAFSELSEVLINYIKNIKNKPDILSTAINQASIQNPWFSNQNILYALDSISKSIQRTQIENWCKRYNYLNNSLSNPETIGVVMAGNIPLVGFHDFFFVMMSDNNIIVKLSSDDKILLPALAKILCNIEPEFNKKIIFTETKLTGFDMIIATGSNNSSRYFEYYFKNHPYIIRKNRNSIAILNGNETKDEIDLLCKDILLYYGMGCRNVSKLFLPFDYNFSELMEAIDNNKKLIDNYKFINNYNYYKSIFLINKQAFLDNGYIILKEDSNINSPLSVVYFEYYKEIKSVTDYISVHSDKIQCIVSKIPEINGSIYFGQTQSPTLSDYADNIDVMDFIFKNSVMNK